MTALDYGMLGEVSRLTSGEKIQRPRPARDRWGRWHRDPAQEWDWFYTLSEADRAYIARNYMAEHGVAVDLLATWAEFTRVDDWAETFVAAVHATRSRALSSLDPLSDEWGDAVAEDPDADELLGPDELASLLMVKRNTIVQWRRRGVLPTPAFTLSALPVWYRGDVMEWAIETARAVEQVEA